MRKRALVWLLALGLASAGCRARPEHRMIGGVVVALASIPVFYLAETNRREGDFYWEPPTATAQSELYFMTGLYIGVMGLAYSLSGGLGYKDESVPGAQERMRAENRLVVHIRTAVLSNRCDAARLMMKRLEAQNPPLAQSLAGSDLEIAQCIAEPARQGR
jgi:hypothetical protein